MASASFRYYHWYSRKFQSLLPAFSPQYRDIREVAADFFMLISLPGELPVILAARTIPLVPRVAESTPAEGTIVKSVIALHREGRRSPTEATKPEVISYAGFRGHGSVK